MSNPGYTRHEVKYVSRNVPHAMPHAMPHTFPIVTSVGEGRQSPEYTTEAPLKSSSLTP
mgnify:CR=1 FL=1